MIPDWAKNLLVKTVIGIFLCIILIIWMQPVSALNIEVSPPHRDVSLTFGQSADNTASVSFTITNNENSTVSGNIGISPTPPSHITITGPPSFTCGANLTTTVQFTIVALPSPSGEDETYTFTIDIGGKPVTVTVTITYYAKIEVSLSPPLGKIDFGEVRHGTTPTSKTTIKIREVYGYKSVEVMLKISGENNWVTSSLSGTISIPAGGESEEIEFTLAAPDDPDHNDYSWTFFLSTTTSHTTISPNSVYIKAYILKPPKLGRLYDEELDIKFDKPKGTVSRYERDIDVRVRNDGDETMHLSSSVSESPGGGISITIVDSPKDVTGKSSKNVRLRVVAPYNAPEGTYHGKVYVDAGVAGHGTVDITIVIKWPVDFFIAPTSIDFGSIELKERGYETKQVDITITETYLYKPVRNLRFSTSGEYGNWLKVKMDFAEIPPGESRTVTIKIEPGLEAVPKDYVWMYNIGAYEIVAKRMEVKAKIVPLNITKMMEGFRSFRGTPLHSNYPSSELIIANGIAMLEVVERSEISAEDWKKIPVLMTGTLSLLSSLNDGIVFTGEKDYGKAVESLSAASVSTATIASNSNLNNRDISGYARDISTEADKTTEVVLMDEAKLLELRGWTLKKAVEHAIANDDISGLKDEENVLESALSYQYAAMLYGLLNDKEKRLENVYEGSVLMDKHDELVSDATDLRIKAENSIANSKENDLSRIWNLHLLVNPYNYDTFLKSYKTAESYLEDASQKYKVAGELLMANNTKEDLSNLKGERRFILSLFFIACIFYCVLFTYAITRIVRGTMAYMRDMYEREVGDLLVT